MNFYHNFISHIFGSIDKYKSNDKISTIKKCDTNYHMISRFYNKKN